MAMVVREIDETTGRVVLSAPGPRRPYAYVVKCDGGCGRDMSVPITYRLPDGTEMKGDPDEKRRCVSCGPFPKEA